MKKVYYYPIIMVMAAILSFAGPVRAAERILFDFEKDAQGWGVPDWCFEKKDYICKTSEISGDVASRGKSSLKLMVSLPGSVWRAGVVECEECSFDWTKYDSLSCDFYLPKDAPSGIGAKLILTVEEGSEWKWTETARAADLIPGEWVTLTASLKPGSKDWMRFMGGDVRPDNPFDPNVSGAEILKITDEFRANVRKIDVRIESDKTSYTGPVYIDNIRLTSSDSKER